MGQPPINRNLHGRAHEKAKDILDSHQPEPLPEEVENHLGEIIQKAERDKGVGGQVV
jgi:trimethylamine:corrinoid methyltransferase-like protein